MQRVDSSPVLTCYRIHRGPSMPIVPASSQRAWMDQTSHRFANRCLPLLIANQHGWVILNTSTFFAWWNGKPGPDSITIERRSDQDGALCPASSHFGDGVLTFHLNYLFRTPPGYNLWIRGPSNLPKDGIAALEGIVETDWSVASFTMNWRFSRAHHVVTFEQGEPVGMLVPVRRGEIENFVPELRDLNEEPELNSAYAAWAASRSSFLSQLKDPNSAAVADKWQKDYMLGVGPNIQSKEHQVKLTLRNFVFRSKEPK